MVHLHYISTGSTQSSQQMRCPLRLATQMCPCENLHCSSCSTPQGLHGSNRRRLVLKAESLLSDSALRQATLSGTKTLPYQTYFSVSDGTTEPSNALPLGPRLTVICHARATSFAGGWTRRSLPASSVSLTPRNGVPATVSSAHTDSEYTGR